MYPIPKDINLQIFKGAIVQQVCFTINTIILLFENKGYIQIEAAFVIKRQNEFKQYEVYPVYYDKDVLKLLEKKVLDIYPKNNNLVIEFEDNYLIELINDGQYESFIINIDGKTTVI
ncbi:MAG: hypothetical protein LBL13_09670 [Bacteroidales bacterium]|jgi:hypothetical protein|nr:hypothetical protein [Bacteroidales bacterium]